MRISEAIGDVSRALYQIQNTIEPAKQFAQIQLNVVAGLRARDLSQNRAPVGDPPRAAIFGTIAGAANTLNVLQSEFIAPVHQVTKAVGAIQQTYADVLKTGTISSFRKFARVNARLNEVMYRVTVVEPKRGGLMLKPKLPQILSVARSSAEAQVRIDQHSAIVQARRATLSEGPIVSARNARIGNGGGNDVVVFDVSRSPVIEAPIKSPSAGDRLRALINF